MSFQKPSKAQELADEMFQSDIRNKQRNSSSAEAYVILTRMRIKQED
jgi:hypothetical protein